ncbi:MAG: hypothetical protein GY861_00330 [bacterium]|nr:hypothetical protein [bacterium]
MSDKTKNTLDYVDRKNKEQVKRVKHERDTMIEARADKQLRGIAGTRSVFITNNPISKKTF